LGKIVAIQRNEIPEQFRWDLTSFYQTLQSWEAEFQKADAEVQEITKFRGKLEQGESVILQAITLHLESIRRIERIYTYAHLTSDEDTSSSAGLALLDRATNLYSRYGAASSFIVPELLSLSDEQCEKILTSQALAPYKRMLEEILRYKPHTLSPKEEELLAHASEIFGSSEKIFSQLNNADLSFGTIKVGNEEVPLTHGSFILLLKNTERSVRETAFKQYYSVFEAHQNTITAALSSSLKTDAFLARTRNYSSALEKALFPDYMPQEVYSGLISTVHEALPALHEYYTFRKERLKLSEQRLFDTHVPLVEDVKTKIPYEKAVEIVLEALKPLGEAYCEQLHQGLTSERWVDVYESKGKRSGAYSSGCYDSHPYMLTNYKEDLLGDLFTLAHEIGHSMHSALSRKAQTYQDFQYGIFVAEVASTFNEQLLLAHLRKHYANDKKMLAYLLNHQLDEIKGTFFRQTMFAEFELETHRLVEENVPLTTDRLKEIYGKLLVDYFGPSMKIEESDWLECLRIPHFYSAFYVYKYATGISAAITLSDKVLSQTPGALEKYLGFLQAGGSKPPLEVLTLAGVDMRKPDAVRRTAEIFKERLGEFKRLYN